MDNPWGVVTLVRDQYRMPLLDADSEPAAYFGLGYAQAQDDLPGLLRQYLLVRGELATVDGPAAVPRDDNQRRWRILREAREGLAGLPEPMRACYEAFIAGVRAWMDEHPELAPDWAPPLEPALPIGVNLTVMLYWVTADAVKDLRAAGVALPPVMSEVELALAGPAYDTPGSNAWVLRPWRTATGETFVVSDPHLPIGGTFALHEATVRAGELHYTGFTFLGAMLPALAHNRHVAWGVTTGGPRVSDAYRIDDCDADHVLLNGLRSPVVAREGRTAYAICTPYTGLAGETERQFMTMLRARDARELRAALDLGAFPPQNLLAADASGECFYLRTGRVPRRPYGSARVLDPSQQWDGFLAQDELVEVWNPASGHLHNCNTAPPDGDWHPDAFNDVPGRSTCRGERSEELLSRAYEVQAEDVIGWALDDLWPDTPRWRAALASAAASDPERVAGWSAARRVLLRRLLAFDGLAIPASRDATAWLAWRTAVAGTDLPPDKLRDLVEALDADLLLGGVERAVDDDRPYGEVHRFAPGVPGRGGAFLSRPVLPDDTEGVLQVSLRATYYAGGRAVAGGPALRIVALGPDGMRSWSVSLPAQAVLYSRGEVKPTRFEPVTAS